MAPTFLSSENLRRTSTEFIGTLIFVFFVGMSKNAGALQPLVPAFTLTFLKYSIGHISLASVNPANSLGLFLRGILPFYSFWPFVLAELCGGVLGAALASAFISDVEKLVILEVHSKLEIGFVAEMVATFVLVFVSLNNTSADSEGNSFYGISAGLALGAIVLIFDPISGACVNPALAMLSIVGTSIHGVPIPQSVWVYFVAPFVGACGAAALFRLVSPNDYAPMQFVFHGPVDHRDGSAPHSSTRLPDMNSELN